MVARVEDSVPLHSQVDKCTIYFLSPRGTWDNHVVRWVVKVHWFSILTKKFLTCCLPTMSDRTLCYNSLRPPTKSPHNIITNNPHCHPSRVMLSGPGCISKVITKAG